MSDQQKKQLASGRLAKIECSNNAARISGGVCAFVMKVVLLAAVAGAITGCKTTQGKNEDLQAIAARATNSAALGTNTAHTETIYLREGNVLKITFPGAPNLDQSPTITRDGNVTLLLIGELKAAGKTLSQFKEDLLKAYASQTDSKEVTVELASSSFPVFVTGAVLQPGKFMSDHPITVLEAIMERGGFDYTKANLKSVEVLRQEGNRFRSYHLNLKDWLEARKKVDLFYMQPGDIIYVREKFSWF